MSSRVTVSSDGPVANFMAKYKVKADAIAARVNAGGKDSIYFLVAADGYWYCNVATSFNIAHAIDCDPNAATRIMLMHENRPDGTSSAVVKFQNDEGDIRFQYGHFTVAQAISDGAKSEDGKRGAARKAFYRQRVDASYNTGAPGIVGVVNLRFSVLARECIDNMPDELYCPRGDSQFELALQLIEQAKDAAVKAVIMTNKTAPAPTASAQ